MARGRWSQDPQQAARCEPARDRSIIFDLVEDKVKGTVPAAPPSEESNSELCCMRNAPLFSGPPPEGHGSFSLPGSFEDLPRKEEACISRVAIFS